MKFLIWFGCFFACVIIQVVLKNMGLILGGIPMVLLYGSSCWIAKKLCAKWDGKRDSEDETN